MKYVSSQIIFIQNKLFLTHHGVMTGFVTEGRAVAVCMDFSKAFDTGSQVFCTKFGLIWSGWGGKSLIR